MSLVKLHKQLFAKAYNTAEEVLQAEIVRDDMREALERAGVTPDYVAENLRMLIDQNDHLPMKLRAVALALAYFDSRKELPRARNQALIFYLPHKKQNRAGEQ